jgi:hypothetical protein
MRLFPENGARQLILGMHGNALPDLTNLNVPSASP